MSKKRCAGPCAKLKSSDAFGMDRSQSDGLRICCRACRRLRQKTSRSPVAIKRALDFCKEMAVIMGKKWCPVCGTAKLPEEFSLDQSKPDGRTPQCKQCRSLMQANYPVDRIRERAASQRYYEKNREKKKADSRRRHALKRAAKA